MGLDIAFNRAQAMKAGMEVCRVIADYTEFEAGYIYEEELVRIPGTEHWLHNGGAQSQHGSTKGKLIAADFEGTDKDIVVRANKWGRSYEPLTYWLRTHNIEWSEF